MEKDNVQAQATTTKKYGSWFRREKMIQNREKFHLDGLCKTIDDNFSKKEEIHVLEVGFNDGKRMKKMSKIYPHAKFVGLEVRKKCVEDMKASGYDCRLVETEIFDMDEKFDVIYGFAVLHHLSNPYDSLESLIKLLKPNGVLVFRNEDQPLNILALTYITIINHWSIEKNLFKMNRRKFINTISRYTKNFSVKYDFNPTIICFEFISKIYHKIKLNRIPFLNNFSIYCKAEQ